MGRESAAIPSLPFPFCICTFSHNSPLEKNTTKTLCIHIFELICCCCASTIPTSRSSAGTTVGIHEFERCFAEIKANSFHLHKIFNNYFDGFWYWWCSALQSALWLTNLWRQWLQLNWLVALMLWYFSQYFLVRTLYMLAPCWMQFWAVLPI